MLCKCQIKLALVFAEAVAEAIEDSTISLEVMDSIGMAVAEVLAMRMLQILELWKVVIHKVVIALTT